MELLFFNSTQDLVVEALYAGKHAGGNGLLPASLLNVSMRSSRVGGGGGGGTLDDMMRISDVLLGMSVIRFLRYGYGLHPAHVAPNKVTNRK